MNDALDRILSRAEAARMAGVRPGTISELVKAGIFPQGVALGPRRVGWRLSEVQAWIANRPPVPRTSMPKNTLDGRARFWERVRSGEMPHPRTAARLKREAAEREAATAGV